jgi:hypothetical protein
MPSNMLLESCRDKLYLPFLFHPLNQYYAVQGSTGFHFKHSIVAVAIFSPTKVVIDESWKLLPEIREIEIH